MIPRMSDIAHEVFSNTQAHHSDMCENVTFINKKEKVSSLFLTGHNIAIPGPHLNLSKLIKAE